MKWTKHGLIYNKTNYATYPTVLPINDVWRIYFSYRDASTTSQAVYIDVEAGNPSNVLKEELSPILPIGKAGTFDDCGISPCWAMKVDGKVYLYYAGWSVKNTVPFDNHIGLAIGDGATFNKYLGPVMGKTHIEPYFVGSVCVIQEGDIFRNWYMSGVGWDTSGERPEPIYNIKHAVSKDGVNWERKGSVAIHLHGEEMGIVKSSVISEDGIYKMWYSYRMRGDYRTNSDTSYRMGYAESKNGLEWNRMDDDIVGLDRSKEGWDSQMMAYPHVINYKNERWMFYNGNQFGKTGIGYATQPI